MSTRAPAYFSESSIRRLLTGLEGKLTAAQWWEYKRAVNERYFEMWQHESPSFKSVRELNAAQCARALWEVMCKKS